MAQVALGRKAKLSLIPSDKDWRELFMKAKIHEVVGIIFPAVESLTKQGAKPPLKLLYEWIAILEQVEASYCAQEETAKSLCEILKVGGFKMMVLKGGGLSWNYPIPHLRPSGDLDIWCFGKEQEVDEYLSLEGIKIDKSHHHHSVFFYNGITVENHFDFINVYSRPSSKLLEKKLKEFAVVGCLEKDGIYYPSAQFNAVFLLRHCAAHFASTKMTIRQVMDWGLFMEKHHNAIEWKEYLSYLKEVGMFRFYNLLGLFCMHYLGFDASVFNGLYNDDLFDRFSHEIISPEFQEQENGKLLRSLWVKPRRWWHNRWKNRLCYPDSLPMTFVYGLWAKLLKPRHFVS